MTAHHHHKKTKKKLVKKLFSLGPEHAKLSSSHLHFSRGEALRRFATIRQNLLVLHFPLMPGLRSSSYPPYFESAQRVVVSVCRDVPVRSSST